MCSNGTPRSSPKLILNLELLVHSWASILVEFQEGSNYVCLIILCSPSFQIDTGYT